MNKVGPDPLCQTATKISCPSLAFNPFQHLRLPGRFSDLFRGRMEEDDGQPQNSLQSLGSAQARRPTRTNRIILGKDVLQGMTVKEQRASSDHYVSSYYPR